MVGGILREELGWPDEIDIGWTDWKVKEGLAEASNRLLDQVLFLVLHLDEADLDDWVNLLGTLVVWVRVARAARVLLAWRVLFLLRPILAHHWELKVPQELLNDAFRCFEKALLVLLIHPISPGDQAHLEDRELEVILVIVLLKLLVDRIDGLAYAMEFSIKLL
jgi:hypothetical protein